MKPSVVYNYSEIELQNAKSSDNIWVVADCDSGGIFLFCAKAASVNCHPSILLGLLTVLEAIAWDCEVTESSRPSVDAAIIFTENLDPDTGLPLAVNDNFPFDAEGVWIGSDDNYKEFPFLPKIVSELVQGRITPESSSPMSLFATLSNRMPPDNS